MFAQTPILTAKTTQLLALRGARPIPATPCVTLGLSHPIAERLCTRFKLATQVFRIPSGSNPLNHLVPELRRIRRSRSRHGGYHLPPKGSGVHQIGSTPGGQAPAMRACRVHRQCQGIQRMPAQDGSIVSIARRRPRWSLRWLAWSWEAFPTQGARCRRQGDLALSGAPDARCVIDCGLDLSATRPAPRLVVHLGDIVQPVPSLPEFHDAVGHFKSTASRLPQGPHPRLGSGKHSAREE